MYFVFCMLQIISPCMKFIFLVSWSVFWRVLHFVEARLINFVFFMVHHFCVLCKKSLPWKSSPVFSSRSFIGVTLRSEILFYIFYCLQYGGHTVPVPFIEKTGLSVRDHFDVLVENQLTIYVRIYFRTLHHILWMHMTVWLCAKPKHLDYLKLCSKSWNQVLWDFQHHFSFSNSF